MIDIAPHVGATAAMTVRVITAVAIVSVIIALGAFVVIIDHLPELENAVLSAPRLQRYDAAALQNRDALQAQDSLYLLVFLGLHDEGGLGHAQLFKASFE
eukprot:g7505.t1